MTQAEINRALSPFADTQDGGNYEDYLIWLRTKRSNERKTAPSEKSPKIQKLGAPSLSVISPGGTEPIAAGRIAEIPNFIHQRQCLCSYPKFEFPQLQK